jgi:hypothetical protein
VSSPYLVTHSTGLVESAASPEGLVWGQSVQPVVVWKALGLHWEMASLPHLMDSGPVDTEGTLEVAQIIVQTGS